MPESNLLYLARWSLFLFLLCGVVACGPAAPEKAERTKSTRQPTVDEDATILQLSSFLLADPANQSEREQNQIINYAIDELIPLERTASGLFYQVLDPGEGEPLQWGDYVRVHYKGYFLDDTVFDSSYRRNKPIDFYIGNMVPGWNEGLQLIRPGGRLRLLLPSALGYGEKGFPDGKEGYLVPPNTVLVFELEVLELLKKAE